jgi:hypothetical protein
MEGGKVVRKDIREIVKNLGTRDISIDAESKLKNKPEELSDYVQSASKEFLVS